MFNIKKTIGLAVAGMVLVSSLAMGASAMTSSNATCGGADENGAASQLSEPAGGGIWNHGVIPGIRVYSDYKHDSLKHGSTVQGENYHYVSGDADPTLWSHATVGYDWSRKTNHAWWHTC